jgi:hypothetical protein
LDSTPETVIIRARSTKNDKVKQIEPVELLRNRDRIVAFTALEIERTKGLEITGKLVERSTKDQSKTLAEISLPQAALQQLLRALRGIEAIEDVATVVVITPDETASSFRLNELLSLLKVNPQAFDGIDATILAQLDTHLHQARRLATMRVAISELDNLLANAESNEHDFQQWCSRNGWAFGIEYADRDDVRSIAAEDKVDLLLPRLSGYRDIIELKRPDTPILRKDDARGTWYWSSDASKAIAQALRYVDVFSEEARNGLRDHKQIRALFPIATIVIGRSKGWSDEQRDALHRLNAGLHRVTLITYDALRAQAGRLLEIVSH